MLQDFSAVQVMNFSGIKIILSIYNIDKFLIN